MEIDNQLLITWGMMVFAGLTLDVGAYLFLRADWKKNGITLTDRFWEWLFTQVKKAITKMQNRIAIALVKYHQDSLDPVAAPKPEVLPEPEVESIPVEIIPVSVEHIGQVRRVEFSMDMFLDTQVEVRIGATREAGVTVEKREL